MEDCELSTLKSGSAKSSQWRRVEQRATNCWCVVVSAVGGRERDCSAATTMGITEFVKGGNLFMRKYLFDFQF